MPRFSTALVLLASAAGILAQTTTTCNPLNSTCPADPALGTTFNQTFDASMVAFDDNYYNVVAGESLISFGDQGAVLTIAEEGQSITVQTKFYVFFGTIEMLFQASSGQGIISTFNMLSDDLDEIDVEIISGTKVSNNYYGWGNATQINSQYPSVSWAADEGFHNYTVVWTESNLEWIFDGVSVRNVGYEAPGLWPQTPCYLKFGIWAGGASTNSPGTIKWAGGPTDWSAGPFTMTVQSLKVTDGHQNVSSYSYNGNSGSWQSIDAVAGESDAYKAMHQESSSQQLEQHWNGLSTTAKIAIAASVLGTAFIAFVIFIVYCMRQRKSGRLEREKADRLWEEQHAELMEYRKQMARGKFATSYLTARPGEKF